MARRPVARTQPSYGPLRPRTKASYPKRPAARVPRSGSTYPRQPATKPVVGRKPPRKMYPGRGPNVNKYMSPERLALARKRRKAIGRTSPPRPAARPLKGIYDGF